MMPLILTKSITIPANNSNSTPSASKGKHCETGDRDSEGEDADDEDGSEPESESEIGEEVPIGVENDFGSTEPPEDYELNVNGEIDINSLVLRKIIGQGSDLTLTTATASKPSGSHQPISTNTSFEIEQQRF